MEKRKDIKQDRLTINFEDIPIESSLGLLAFGDKAFTAWREVKKSMKKDIDEKK